MQIQSGRTVPLKYKVACHTKKIQSVLHLELYQHCKEEGGGIPFRLIYVLPHLQCVGSLGNLQFRYVQGKDCRFSN